MNSRWRSLAHGGAPGLWGWDAAARWVLGGTAVVALLYTLRQSPGSNEITAVLVVSAMSLTGLAFPRGRSMFFAGGGGVAVAFTSREFFSFWPAATALLIMSALCSPTLGRSRLYPIMGASALGLIAAAQRDLAPAVMPVAVTVIAVSLMHPLTVLISRARALEVEAARLRERARASEEQSREAERRASLARELHDTLGHHITAIVVQAEAGQVGTPDLALRTIGELGREALEELEAVLFELRHPTSTGPAIDLGRIDAKLSAPLRQQGIDVTVSIDTEERDPRLLKTLYRGVQEALTNVMRHAQATHVSVEICDQVHEVVARVSDNGTGMPSSITRGSGLKGIDERARRLGGGVRITRATPQGCSVEMHLPRSSS